MIGESDAILREDLLNKNKNYSQTKTEWLKEQGVQINAVKYVNGAGTNTVYTVPLGKTFYLTNFTLSGYSAGSTQCALRCSAFSNTEIGTISYNANSVNYSQSYEIPIILQENDTITLQTVGGTVQTATIQGFEINKSIFQ